MDYFWSYNWFEVKQATRKGCRTHAYRPAAISWATGQRNELIVRLRETALSLSLSLPASICHLSEKLKFAVDCARVSNYPSPCFHNDKHVKFQNFRPSASLSNESVDHFYFIPFSVARNSFIHTF